MSKHKEVAASSSVNPALLVPHVTPAQGLVPLFSNTGDPQKDFHRRFTSIRMLDPKSLVNANGEDPFLAIPRPFNDGGGYAVKQVSAEHAAYLLSCNSENGQAPMCRLATDEEVSAYKAKHFGKQS